MAYRKSLDFLPKIFQTETNEKILRATIDQLISSPDLRKVDGYIGRKFNPALTPGDSYIQEDFSDRQEYQLEPSTVCVNELGEIEFVSTYNDLINRIRSLGGIVDRPHRLFEADQYTYTNFFDFDKFINYNNYYWLPNGPSSVSVFATEIPMEQTIQVFEPDSYRIVEGFFAQEPYDAVGYDVSPSSFIRMRRNGYRFSTTGRTFNPIIRLARGGTYQFQVNQSGHGFFIQAEPGLNESYSWQQNLNNRDILGVENNGADVGVITFRVPLIDEQDFFIEMERQAKVDLVAFSTKRRRQLTYKEVQNANAETFIRDNSGIDGQRFLQGKTVLFLEDPSLGKTPQPWQPRTFYNEGDLVIYANTVYRVLSSGESPRTFGTSNLEIFDSGDHWYDPGLFDATTGFDTENFDRGDDVPLEQRKGWFTININSEGLIKLTPSNVVNTGKKVLISEGITYGNKEVYRSNDNRLRLIPPITANRDRLFYQDSLDPTLGGVIELVDQEAGLTVDVDDIIGRINYTSPNGVLFENGLKVRFSSDARPEEYANKEFYVEGVGSAIDLSPVDELLTPEPWLETVSLHPFDIELFDAAGFDQSQPAPIEKQYTVIKRNSQERSSWARQNRWFHQSVIENTNKYNNFFEELDQDSKAKRPIVELDANLQLFNHGRNFSRHVTVIDNEQPDALSNVKGTRVENATQNQNIVTYYADGVPLTNNTTVVFAADTDPNVRNKIWRVRWILPESDSTARTVGISGNGNDTYDLGFTPAGNFNVSVLLNGIDITNAGIDWNISGREITFTAPITVGNNVTLEFSFGQQIHLEVEKEIEDFDTILVELGRDNQGNMWYFENGNWHIAQNKNQTNQVPKFDLFNENFVSLSDSAEFPGSTFAGNELFGYKIGTGVVDSELQIPLTYRSLGNVGDIVYENYITSSTFAYEVDGASQVKSVDGSLVRKNKNVNQDNDILFNQWAKSNDSSKQFVTDTFFATDIKKNLFRLSALPEELSANNFIVYVNNRPIVEDRYDIVIVNGIGYLEFEKELQLNDKVDVRIYSETARRNVTWEIPSNFENNSLNSSFNDFTLGQIRDHILENYIKTPGIENAFQGNSNAKDVGNTRRSGGKILQNQGNPHLANLFLNDEKCNYVESIMYAQREYQRFKNKFQQLATDMALDATDIPTSVDIIMQEITEHKNPDFPFYRSDMVPFGSDFNLLRYVVDNPTTENYFLSEAHTGIPNRSILVYLNGVLLTKDKDYFEVPNEPVIRLNIEPELTDQFVEYLEVNIDDVIEIREYFDTDGCYVPPTPTKLGLYPSYEPMLTEECCGSDTTALIRCHDGSFVVAYGDYRDDLLLELEKRIYNNIKTTYDDRRFDVLNKIPGAFRSTAYSKSEFDQIISRSFGVWSGTNNLKINDYNNFDSNNPFTWNYNRFTSRITGELLEAGGWRGIYRYYYDTEQPNLTPWEMLGYSIEPEWWKIQYGPAPYTKGNRVLWEDLEAGIIKGWPDETPYVDERFVRSGFSSIIPVDESGNLLPPATALAKNNSINVDNEYRFGDVGPVESIWRQSSDYPFAVQMAMALMFPAAYFGALQDTSRQVVKQFGENGEQWVYADSLTRGELAEINGEEINGEIVRNLGYLYWISEYARFLGIDVEFIGSRIRNLDIRLAYKVGGYTDKKYVKFFADQASPASTSSSVVIPDSNYSINLVKSSLRKTVTYSGVIVTSTGTGWVVEGYDNNNPFFPIIEASDAGETKVIRSGNDAITVRVSRSGQVGIIPYGTEFISKAAVVDFLIGYEKYLEEIGFVFGNNQVGTASNRDNWTLSAKEFLFWTQQGWEADSAITLSPIGNKIEYRTSRGTIDTITGRPIGSRVLDNNFNIVSKSDYTVNRDRRNFSLTLHNGRTIALIDLSIVDYEHIVIFDNRTQFNDIIYDPVLGSRQFRLKMSGFKTSNWDGAYGAPGFIINPDTVKEWKKNTNYAKGEIVFYKGIFYVAIKNIPGSKEFDFSNWNETDYRAKDSTLLPNLANKSDQQKNFYNFNEANLELDADRLAKSFIGFSPRGYLDDLGISDTSQIKFYQGLISQKGSNNSLDKMLRARVDNFQGQATFYEQWAVRTGSYGATDNRKELRIPLKEKMRDNTSIVLQTLGANDNPIEGAYGYKENNLLSIQRPFDPNFFSYRSKAELPNDLPTSGFVKEREVDYKVYDIEELVSVVRNENIRDGDTVWVANDQSNLWGVYRFTDTSLFLKTITIASNRIANIETRTPHDLSPGDLIYLSTTNVQNFSSAYVVNEVLSSTEFNIRANFSALETSQAIGRIYKMINTRLDNPNQIVEFTPKFGWRLDEKLYIDNLDQNNWGVLEKKKAYATPDAYIDSQGQPGDNAGSSIVTDLNSNYLMMGVPGQSVVKTFKRGIDGLLPDARLVVPNQNVTDFGTEIAINDVGDAVGSAPLSDDTGYVFVMKQDATGSFIFDQALAPLTLDTGGEYGRSVAISSDGRWLYVGQPGNDEGYVWVYQKIKFDSGEITLFSDGVETEYSIAGLPSVPNSIYAIRIVTVNNQLLIPYRDYVLNGDDIVFTSPIPFGEFTVSTADYYELILAATLSDEIGARFAQSIATTTDGEQILIGSPLEDVNGITDSGKIYVVDRTIEKFIANGSSTEFVTNTELFGFPRVLLNDIELTLGEDYGFDGTSTYTFPSAPESGSIITIETNNPILSQIVDATEISEQEELNFGQALDICPNNCSLYSGSPKADTTLKESGKVFRFINRSRFYGDTQGTVENPVTSDNTLITLNSFPVLLPAGSDLDTVVDIINTSDIPGVSAQNLDNKIYIETDREIVGDRLKIVDITETFFDDFGIEVYVYRQTITAPNERDYLNFGKTVKVAPEASTIAIGSDIADSVIVSDFDGQETTFDKNTAKFNQVQRNSGNVYVYEYIRSANESFNTPGQFVFADTLTPNNIESNDSYGNAIAISRTAIFASAPAKSFDNEGERGVVFGFTRDRDAKIWNVLRREKDKIDTNLINRAYIYNRVSGQRVVDLDVIDPIARRIPGVALQELSYITSYDPAYYNTQSGTSSKGSIWGKEKLGEVWWNTSKAKWLDYTQGDIEYNISNWGRLFAGSEIECFEWIESSVPPADYFDRNNPNARAKNVNDFNSFTEYDDRTGAITRKYYFWATGIRRTPVNVPNRRISLSQIQELIENPKTSNLPYVVLAERNTLVLYNVDQFISDDNLVLAIDCDVSSNRSLIHNEFQLINDGDENSQISDDLLDKIIYSLAGFDDTGSSVPDRALLKENRLGIKIRPRQTIFKDRKNALREAVEYINIQLSKEPVIFSKNTNKLFESDPQPDTTEYDEKVMDLEQLEFLPVGIYSVGFKVLVESDSTARDRWVLYVLDENREWKKERIQTYNNNRYLELTTWKDPDVDIPNAINRVVDFEFDLQSIAPNIEPGEFVRIRDNGLGLSKVVIRTPNRSWRTVQEEEATVKIKDTVWRIEKNQQGWDVDGFGVQLFDDEPSIEIRNIFKAIYNDVLTGTLAIERNQWAIHMFKVVLAEQKSIDWLFKTSLIAVDQRQRELEQIPVFQRDNQDLILEYINEIKPYHTKVSELVLGYDSSDVSNSYTTDFDLPAYYSFQNNRYQVPTGNNIEDDFVLTQSPYIDWVENHKLKIEDVEIYNGGTGYITPPDLIVFGGGGSGAKLKAVVGNGRIIRVEIVDSGQGYITTPNIFVDPASGGTGARLFARMKNNEVRQIKTNIKFDRVSTGGGFTIQFRDNFGQPVDIRNEKLSRLNTNAGVIDVLLNLLSLEEWIVDDPLLENVYPVNNIPAYYIEDNSSGRVHVLDRRDSRGWTAELLQLFLRSQGFDVGANNLDITGTTVVNSGNMVTYQPTLLEWIPGYNYIPGDVIVNNNEAWSVVTSFTAGPRFESTNLEIMPDGDFESHMDRMAAYYQPKADMPGAEVEQLFEGVTFDGVYVQGANFNLNPGFDVSPYDFRGFDRSFIGPEGVPTLDPAVLDQTLQSKFEDLNLGLRPEDIITFGGNFISPEHGHSSEEMVAGSAFDSLSITVQTLPTTAALDGAKYSPETRTFNYQGDGSTTRFYFTGRRIGDYFLVYSLQNGPIYRNPEETGQSSTPVPESAYNAAINRSYRLNLVEQYIEFDNPPAAGDIIQLINYGQVGEQIVLDRIFFTDGETTEYDIPINQDLVAGALLLVDGVKYTNFTVEFVNSVVRFITGDVLDSGQQLRIVISGDTSADSLTYIHTQLEQLDGFNRNIPVTENLRVGRSKDSTIIVELNGSRLRPGNSVYYTGNGNTTNFALPNSAEEDYTTISIGDVRVWVDKSSKDSSDFVINTVNAIPEIEFFDPPEPGADISIAYINDADFLYSRGSQEIIIQDQVNINNGDVLAITSFSAHDALDIRTKVFIGTDQFANEVVVTPGFSNLGFDTTGFDSDDLVTTLDIAYEIDSDQNSAEDVFVTVNGTKLMALRDYVISNGVITMSDNIEITSNSTVVITWMSSTQYRDISTFQYIDDMIDNKNYYSIFAQKTTELARELKLGDSEILVVDGSALDVPTTSEGIPGQIYVNGEIIHYWKKDGNTLSQLRRSVKGTGATKYEIGTSVRNIGRSSEIEDANDSVWVDYGIGLGLAQSQSKQVKFLYSAPGAIIE